MNPIGTATQKIGELSLDGINKGTTIRSLNRQSASRFLLGIPLMFSRKLTVWDPQKKGHVYTSVSKSEWKKVKGLARRNAADVGRLSKQSLTTRKKLALEIIRKSGDTSRLSVLDRASPQQLCIIARGLARYGHDAKYREKVFEALRGAQDQWQAMSMDPQTLDMVNEFVASQRSGDPKSVEASKKQLYAAPHLERLEQTKPRAVATQEAEFPDMFRKFMADLFSEDERDRNQVAGSDTLAREKRLKEVFQKHSGVTHALMLHGDKVEQNIGELAASCGVSTDIVREIVEIASTMRPGGTGLALAPSEAKRAVSNYPERELSSFAKRLDNEVDRYDLQKLGTYLKDNIPPEAGNFGKFLTKVFEQYFSTLSTADRRAVISSYLREAGAQDSEEKHMVAALKGSGPYLLKILQLMGDTVDTSTESGRTLKQALGELKDGLLPIAPDIQQAMVEDMLKSNPTTIRGLTQLRSLGAASVGETLMARATLANGDTRDVVLKLLKPGVDQRAARERAVMERIASDIPGMDETFAGIADQIDRELDLTREADNVERAAVYRKAGLGYLQPVKKVERLDPTQEFMFMERAEGGTVKDTLDELGRDDGQPIAKGDRTAQKNLENRLAKGAMVSDRLKSLSQVWLRQALFGNGFFHGDLHSGNMMYGDTARQTGLLTLIDFGNAGTLSRQDRAGMLKLMLAAENRYPERFVETLATMVGPKSQEALKQPGKHEALTQAVSNLFADPTLSGSQRMLEAFNLANTFDVAIPNAISNFSRSQSMLDLTIRDMNTTNRANWEGLKAAGVDGVAEPEPVNLSNVFKATVQSQKKQIIALTGMDGWNMRNQNAALPLRPMPEPGRATESEQPSSRLIPGSDAQLNANAQPIDEARLPPEQPGSAGVSEPSPLQDEEFNNFVRFQRDLARQGDVDKANYDNDELFIKSFVSKDDVDRNSEVESEQGLDDDFHRTQFMLNQQFMAAYK